MDRLIWPTAKAQLYLTEAAHVKEAIGRHRIHRNKDALRELGCLQEILVDLHQREYSCASPKRQRAAESALERWQQLKKAAATSQRPPEELCEVPSRVHHFLRTRSVSSTAAGVAASPGVVDSSEAALSTRAPSTAAGCLDVDGQSAASATEYCRSEATASHADDGLPGPLIPNRSAGRMSRTDLNKLAVELREQIDQEYTSLMTSIEEVQALMEAEVAGTVSWPSSAELLEFAAAVDSVVAALPQARLVEDQDIAPAVDVPAKNTIVGLTEFVLSEKNRVDSQLRGGPLAVLPECQWSDREDAEADAQTIELPDDHADVSTVTEEPLRPSAQELVVEVVDPSGGWMPGDCVGRSCQEESGAETTSPSSESRPGDNDDSADHQDDTSSHDAPAAARGRSRWADMSSDESDSGLVQEWSPLWSTRSDAREVEAVALDELDSLTTPRAAEPHPRSFICLDEMDGLAEPEPVDEEQARRGRQTPAVAECSACGLLLGRSAFSRRSWRQARGLGGHAKPAESAAGGHGACCTSCTEQRDADLAAAVGHPSIAPVAAGAASKPVPTRKLSVPKRRSAQGSTNNGSNRMQPRPSSSQQGSYAAW
eukprot:TRINITY_DN35169_c0_g1_i1.p1 TRINITY_DN35169_c0_g1~~TRINITY_DN35169_c0_g1_i1.p1  ORF type:complete len:598 (-),score=121.71 TRINITY_DN35169_c0_g1_i1:93-1886(-)